MAGVLAHHLQNAMRGSVPRGWRAVGVEQRLLPSSLSTRLGYAPAADLLVESQDGRRRIWVELEISRADPVANHAKFAVSSMVQPFPGTFVAMVSSHVQAGRRTLAAHAISLMRRMGVDAFQTTLFPQLSPDEIARLNHLPPEAIGAACPPIRPEWDRLLAVVEPLAEREENRILFVGDPAEVAWNVHRWNEEIATPEGARLWAGRRGFRAVEHYVWWPRFDLFAPSKFAAFVPAGGALGMSMALYAELDESEPRFDGRRAWTHLERIGFFRADGAEARERFERWRAGVGSLLRLRGEAPVLWQPPDWVR